VQIPSRGKIKAQRFLGFSLPHITPLPPLLQSLLHYKAVETNNSSSKKIPPLPSLNKKPDPFTGEWITGSHNMYRQTAKGGRGLKHPV